VTEIDQNQEEEVKKEAMLQDLTLMDKTDGILTINHYNSRVIIDSNTNKCRINYHKF
jgi:hypothetical protein